MPEEKRESIHDLVKGFSWEVCFHRSDCRAEGVASTRTLAAAMLLAEQWACEAAGTALVFKERRLRVTVRWNIYEERVDITQ